MSAVRRRFLLELRHGGWRFVVVVTLVLAVGGGAALAALAGARRTASAFERLERTTLAGNLLVNPDDPTTLVPERVQALPGVAASGAAYGLGATDADGKPLEAAFLGLDRAIVRTIERPRVLRGRLPDPDQAGELFANPEGGAALGVGVGDSVEMYVVPGDVDPAMVQGPLDEVQKLARSEAFGRRQRFTLVGIGVTTSDVVPGATLPTIYATPAFLDAYHPLRVYEGVVVRLRDGEHGIDAFSARVRDVATPGASIDFQTTRADRATVNRSVRPQVVALGVFGLVLGIGVLAAVGQALGRRTQLGRRDDTALSALGMTRTERGLVDVVRAAVGAVAGGVGAVLVAVALSPLLPFGVARQVEPDPGVRVDTSVLVLGGVLLVVCTLGAGVLAAFRAHRKAEGRAGPSVVVGALSRLQRSPTVETGIRFALDPGSSDNPIPTRSTLVGAAIGIAAIVASLTFAGSLDHFVTTPRSYGWDFDAHVRGSETSEVSFDDVAPDLPTALDSADVRGWSVAYLDQTTVGGQIVPVLAVKAGGGEPVNPTIVKGRAPSAADEVALGAATMRASGVGIGDRVIVGGGSTEFDVVGTVVLPGLHRYQASDQAALGSGALLTLDGFKRASTVGRVEGTSSPSGLLVRVVPPAGERERARVQERLDEVIGKGNLVVDGPLRPSDVISYARVRGVPIVLAAVLAMLAAITVGHALVMAVRQRRIDLAVLHALGFTRRQIGRTVAWQASTVAILAAVIGIPLGLIVGRMAWSAVAHQLGIVDLLVVPVLGVALIVPVALLLANAMAAVPARRASALRMADALRAE
jgi:FtsX-like permease family